jgi:hypothetical protein
VNVEHELRKYLRGLCVCVCARVRVYVHVAIELFKFFGSHEYEEYPRMYDVMVCTFLCVCIHTCIVFNTSLNPQLHTYMHVYRQTDTCVLLIFCVQLVWQLHSFQLQ